MKKILRYILIFFSVVLVLIAGLLIYVKTFLPNVGPAQEVKIEYTPERVLRGKYLANHVTVCMDCHSKRDYSIYAAPMAPGTLGMGGDVFDQKVGLPGAFYSKNITPAGIGRYTDGELLRVITTGVTKEGHAMFPLMPYKYYGRLDTEDVYSIIAYVRSIPAIENQVPESKPDFPMNFIVNTIPEKASPQPKPDTTDALAYGAYLTNAASCRECHSQVDKGVVIPGLEFAGGREFVFPDGNVVKSANITADDETGLGKWTKAGFVNRFKLYADSGYTALKLAPGDVNTVMPWTMYAGMKTSDLEAIYTYLHSVKGIHNKIK